MSARLFWYAASGAIALLIAHASTSEAAPQGQALFNQQCRACHQVGANARNGLGPHLNGVFDRPAGSVSGFNYSDGF